MSVDRKNQNGAKVGWLDCLHLNCNYAMIFCGSHEGAGGEAMENTHCDAVETLKKAGLAKTNQRLAVLERLIRADRPLNAQEILKDAVAYLRINRVTVYRILASLRDGGVIREIESGQGMSFYEMACLHNPIHPHFRCRCCGRILCMSPLTLSQAWEWFARPYDFCVEAVDIRLTGICDRCGREDNRNTFASIRNRQP